MITSLIFAESASVAVLSKFLSCTHYAIPEIATTYKSGVAILKTQKPDMVYIDVSFVKKHHMELSHLKSRGRFILLCDDLEDYNTYSWLFEDVLLKPFDFDKFKMCSFNLLTGWVASLLKMKDPSAGDYFTLRDGNKQRDFTIDLEDLLYMESCGNYVQVFDIYGGNEMVRTTMKECLNNLPAGNFSRIHSSYIINHKWICLIIDDGLYLNNKEKTMLRIGVAFRKAFYAKEGIRELRSKWNNEMGSEISDLLS